MPYDLLIKEAQTLVARLPYERLKYLVGFLKTEEDSLSRLVQQGLDDAESGQEEEYSKVFTELRAGVLNAV